MGYGVGVVLVVDKIASWAKGLDRRENFFGKIIRLLYEICVCSPFQGAVHLIASCILGAFCYKDGVLNYKFLIPFGIVYLIAIVVFGICNQHRKHRNDSIKGYELSFPRISKAFQEECRKDMELYNLLSGKNFAQMVDYYSVHDVYSEACFRVCAAVDELLQEISGLKSFRVVTFLRTTNDKDEYYINGYSPQDPAPEACRERFDLDKYKGKHRGKGKKDIPVHARPFLNKRFEPIIYIDTEVENEYLDFNDQHPTKLHISIPCSVNNKVVAVLQITSYDNCLGTKSNIKDLIENSLAIFISYLKVVYMHQMEHELWVNSMRQFKEVNVDGQKQTS